MRTVQPSKAHRRDGHGCIKSVCLQHEEWGRNTSQGSPPGLLGKHWRSQACPQVLSLRSSACLHTVPCCTGPRQELFFPGSPSSKHLKHAQAGPLFMSSTAKEMPLEKMMHLLESSPSSYSNALFCSSQLHHPDINTGILP